MLFSFVINFKHNEAASNQQQIILVLKIYDCLERERSFYYWSVENGDLKHSSLLKKERTPEKLVTTVGYSSPAQFSREYKRHYGFAPSAT